MSASFTVMLVSLSTCSVLARVRPDAPLRAGHQSGNPRQSNGVLMFEYDQAIVQTLLTENDQFAYLYKRHDDLKDKVRKAELGDIPLDDQTLVSMKKEKLLAKDKMAAIIEDYRRENAAA